MKVPAGTARFLPALLLVVFAGAVGFAGSLPEPFVKVSEVVDDPEGFRGRTLEVKGRAEAVDPELGTFVLTDGATRLSVRLARDASFPVDFADGRITVVTSVLRGDADGPYLEASKLLLGCPSKYEAA
ncbi:MAG: cytochrome c maturation protein CcmE domain-containing protein [Methanobacteriota archaeon]